jgi:NAD(P)H-flavin reductase
MPLPASTRLGDDPMVSRPAPILAMRREAQDVFTLTLDVSRRPQAFSPGQFTMLYLFGVGEIPVSISGDPACPERLAHTIRAVGSVTRPMQALTPGSALGVRGPFGTGWPLEAARGKDIILIAGGIGMAPLRPLIYQLRERRDDYRRISVLYGVRSPADIVYGEELAGWRANAGMDVSLIVDHASPGWRGDVGVVTTLLDRVGCDPHNTLAMTCGPEIMMRFAIRELNHLGIADKQIYVSMERNMQCAVGLCGHCQYGPTFICRDGPVFRFDRIRPFFGIRDL